MKGFSFSGNNCQILNQLKIFLSRLRRVSRREFETSIADQIRECRKRIDEDEKEELSFMVN